jgi:hypothetical protein
MGGRSKQRLYEIAIVGALLAAAASLATAVVPCPSTGYTSLLGGRGGDQRRGISIK